MSLARIRGLQPPAREWVARAPVVVLLAMLTVLAVGIRPLCIGVLALAVVTGELVRIDVAEHRLPNRIVLPLYPVVLLALAAEWAAGGTAPLPALASGAGVFVFLLLLSIAGGMGMGDVKLGGVLGLCLGALGVHWVAVGLVCAFLFGAIGGAAALLAPSSGPAGLRARRRVAFGPFLLAGFWLAVVASGLVGEASGG
ncbi:prepilin peptidase [Mycetocola zhujimingii]|uniref:prepilin peptidase n=1 Tax=Mycetocola zhujimingii TaxID=2079792 RepID=UPI000D3B4C05|nr:prepilin peptidase [Mycetocola zhujimingii]AWB86942.1 prepilin peptidase [Mycetocola zhujimingii]